MTSKRALPWYYAVNDRPVKMVATSDGGMEVMVLDMKTGEFKRDMSYLSQVSDGGKDVDEFDETAFNRRVESIRKDLGNKR
ncbi:MAG: hypothetical protein ABI321_24195 [Polyangia bacterium]